MMRLKQKRFYLFYFAKEECVAAGAGDNNDEEIEEEQDLHKQKVHCWSFFYLLIFQKKRNESTYIFMHVIDSNCSIVLNFWKNNFTNRSLEKLILEIVLFGASESLAPSPAS